MQRLKLFWQLVVVLHLANKLSYNVFFFNLSHFFVFMHYMS